MISLIIKSYFAIILAIGLGSITIFALGLYWILKPAKPTPAKSHDIEAIAGEDPFATQLDLARAFIETDKIISAKNILKSVSEQGSVTQQEEAKRLLSSI